MDVKTASMDDKTASMDDKSKAMISVFQKKILTFAPFHSERRWQLFIFIVRKFGDIKTFVYLCGVKKNRRDGIKIQKYEETAMA